MSRRRARFTDPKQFENVVIRSDNEGRQVRVGDVARVEIGAQDYGTSAYLDNNDSVIIPVFQVPGSNALAAADTVKAEMQTLSKDFPPGLQYRIVYNPTEFIQQSVDAVIHTLFEAVVLVVIVIIVFLQKWRASLIPVLAIPVSLIGTFAVLATLGYSLNNLSLFGLVLAIGIVVDDAIVVVENVERNLEDGMSPLEAARASMDEVGFALIAIVLGCAVFVPTVRGVRATRRPVGRFLQAVRGDDFCRHGDLADRLADALAGTLGAAAAAARAGQGRQPPRAHRRAGGIKFNRGFERFSHTYARWTSKFVAIPRTMMAIYAVLIAATVFALSATPTGFVPQQDQAYFLTVIQLPPGSATSRTDAVMKKVAARMLKIPGIKGTVMLSGFRRHL